MNRTEYQAPTNGNERFAAYRVSDDQLVAALAATTVPHSTLAGQIDGRYCVICGELEGSSYAKHCCTLDNMIDDGGKEE